jgi:hypothetical protein
MNHKDYKTSLQLWNIEPISEIKIHSPKQPDPPKSIKGCLQLRQTEFIGGSSVETLLRDRIEVVDFDNSDKVSEDVSDYKLAEV